MNVARSSLFSRICTAFLVAVGFAVVYAMAAVWLGAILQRFFEKDSNSTTTEMLSVEPDGTVLIAWYDYEKRQYQYRSLDGHPASQKVEGEQIRGSFVFASGDRPARGLQDVNQEGWAGCVFPFADNARPPTYWYFVLADDSVKGRGYFAGYDAQTRLSVGYLSQGGFTTTVPVRSAQFPIDGARFRYGGTLLASSHSPRSEGFSPSGPVEMQPEYTFPPWIVYLFSGGELLKIDLVRRTVDKALAADDILSVGQNFRTEVTTAKSPRGGNSMRTFQTFTLRRPERITLFNPIDEIMDDWQIPVELQKSDFTFYPIAAQESLVELSHWNAENQKFEHNLAWFNSTGGITRRENISLKMGWTTPSGLAAFGPFLVMPEVLLWVCLLPTMDANQPGGIPTALADIWPGPLFILLTTVAALILTDRKQRRAGLPRSYPWLVFVLLLGLPGYIGFLVHRRWPSQVPVPRPEHTGIEVFA